MSHYRALMDRLSTYSVFRLRRLIKIKTPKATATTAQMTRITIGSI